MRFDIFHSLARIDTVTPQLSDRQCFANFFEQSALAETLGFDTLWLAESHFSSERQKSHPEPVIPNFIGEVGLNCDSFQLIQMLMARTQKLNFGTAIHNIVGGNGGPIASADRVNTLAFHNQFLETPRDIYLGFAAGRFPYINAPFGIVPRNASEAKHWNHYKRHIFLEATEVFLRLCLGETFASVDTRSWEFDNHRYQKRWEFDVLELVPKLSSNSRAKLHFVLGSHDPLAHELAFAITDVDVFNLSFTPPPQIELVHEKMTALHEQRSDRRPWQRNRMPRTVLIFIDRHQSVAEERASACFDTYSEAMRGTVQLPPKSELMARALVGTPDQISQQLSLGSPHGFHPDDRLMLWFEFNQSDHSSICQQMALFAEVVAPRFTG